MKMTLSTSQAADELYADKYANWSRAGAYALAEYLEELEDDTGTEIEFDRVAIRCDFSEYGSLSAFREEYFSDMAQCLDAIGADDASDDDELDDMTREYISDNGTLIEFSGGIIVSSF